MNIYKILSFGASFVCNLVVISAVSFFFEKQYGTLTGVLLFLGLFIFSLYAMKCYDRERCTYAKYYFWVGTVPLSVLSIISGIYFVINPDIKGLSMILSCGFIVSILRDLKDGYSDLDKDKILNILTAQYPEKHWRQILSLLLPIMFIIEHDGDDNKYLLTTICIAFFSVISSILKNNTQVHKVSLNGGEHINL